MQFTIGADPEVFVGDGVGVRSIIGKIGGTKELPLPLLNLGEGFAVQEDNVALEFNIPPSKHKAEFVAHICKATDFLGMMVQNMFGYQLVHDSAISFPEAELNVPAAHVFGCDPDYNAWTRARNPRPKAKDKNLRSCGGHIHIGFDDLDPVEVVKACDLFLSVPASLMDKGELRKQLYGKAGAFRKTVYGVEYRPLSNFWIFNQRLVEWAYDNTKRALEAVAAGYTFDSERERILRAVDDNDKVTAGGLVHDYGLEVVNA